MSDHHASVEDWNSEVSEAIPATRRVATKSKSGLANCMSAGDEHVSDSGYSSQSANSPSNDDSLVEPAPAQDEGVEIPPNPSTPSRRESMKRAGTPGTAGGSYGYGRPHSKSFSRGTPPAIPRNIPGTVRPRSQSITTGGADECDCSDCGKKGPTKQAARSPESPSAMRGDPYGNYGHAGSYGRSPQWSSYPYPYEYPSPEQPTKSSKRSSMPPPPRPSSTFSGTSTSFSYGPPYYPPTASSPAPQAPPPAQTCPPTSGYSPYAPPPINTSLPPSTYSIPSPAPYSAHDYYPSSYTAPTSAYPDYHPPPPHPIHRRNSMRAQAAANASYDEHFYPPPPPAAPPRRNRPPSWTPGSFQEHAARSMSVPPQEPHYDPPHPRRKPTTPAPERLRRRDSGYSRPLGPSLLSREVERELARSMDACAIADDDMPPVTRTHSRGHSQQHGHEYYTFHNALTRQPRDDSDDEELFEVEPEIERRKSTKRRSNGYANPGAYAGDMDRYVAQRQQQVHAQIAGYARGEVMYGVGVEGATPGRRRASSNVPPPPDWAHGTGYGAYGYATYGRAPMGADGY